MDSWNDYSTMLVQAKDGGHHKHKNLYGKALQPCSTAGMAVTGFTGNGYCDHNSMGDAKNSDDDEFAHTICIDLASFGGREFFDTTGQPDWSDSQNRELPCMEDSDEAKWATTNNNLSSNSTSMKAPSCPIVHWCTSETDNASYSEAKGGCDALGHIICDSTNAKVVTDYEEAAAQGDEKAVEALACLKLKCWF